jgi:hypothetical protein
LRAKRDAMVLLPAPAGPSIAIINFREEWLLISECDCTRQSKAGE